MNLLQPNCEVRGSSRLKKIIPVSFPALACGLGQQPKATRSISPVANRTTKIARSFPGPAFRTSPLPRVRAPRGVLIDLSNFLPPSPLEFRSSFISSALL